jgi:hypothetical protein
VLNRPQFVAVAPSQRAERPAYLLTEKVPDYVRDCTAVPSGLKKLVTEKVLRLDRTVTTPVRCSAQLSVMKVVSVDRLARL